jgi:nitrate/nitrite transporter NarK
VWNSNVVPD